MFFLVKAYVNAQMNLTRGSSVAEHESHKLEVDGANPSPAPFPVPMTAAVVHCDRCGDIGPATASADRGTGFLFCAHWFRSATLSVPPQQAAGARFCFSAGVGVPGAFPVTGTAGQALAGLFHARGELARGSSRTRAWPFRVFFGRRSGCARRLLLARTCESVAPVHFRGRRTSRIAVFVAGVAFWLATPAFAFGATVRSTAPAEIGLPAPLFWGLVFMLAVFGLSVLVVAVTKVIEVLEEWRTRNRPRGNRRLGRWLGIQGGLK